MPTNVKEIELLEQIFRKLNNSPVLNGGFDKLVVVVDTIKDKQEQTEQKIDGISEALYTPADGLFARMQSLEHSAKSLQEDHRVHIQEDIKALTTISEEIKHLGSKQETEQVEQKTIQDTTLRLKRVAGEDLEHLTAVVKLQKNLTKVYWALAIGGAGTIGKLIWDIVQPHLGR